MPISQDQLFSDVMQITQRQGNYDDSEFSTITSTDSALWKSALGRACQELTKDHLILRTTTSGTTVTTQIQDRSATAIDSLPSDFYKVEFLYVNSEELKEIPLSDFFSDRRNGYAINSVPGSPALLITFNTTYDYDLYYWQKWPVDDNWEPETDLSDVDAEYYNLLMYKTCSFIHQMFDNAEKELLNERKYQEADKNIAGEGVTIYSAKVAGRP